MEIEIIRASTRELGERLLALAAEYGIGEGERWNTIDCPEAAAIIQELRRRNSSLARDALEAVSAGYGDDDDDEDDDEDDD